MHLAWVTKQPVVNLHVPEDIFLDVGEDECVGVSAHQSRANFDDWNLEDILSLLAFELFNEDPAWKKDYDTMVEAIRETIELSCALKFESHTPSRPYNQGKFNIYHQFWSTLFSKQLRHNLSAIITFNYDLVLERSLWQFFHQVGSTPLIPDFVTLEYCYDRIKTFRLRKSSHCYYSSGGEEEDAYGVKAEFDFANQDSSEFSIPYLKLHGSVNWTAGPSLEPVSELGNILLSVSPKPLILPPVFNKIDTAQIRPVWGRALSILRNAKNIVVVGYSLPRTDAYMQYFLKAGIGPNGDLNKITVFDPVIFKNNEESRAMRERYSECFSPHFQERIDFCLESRPKDSTQGTFADFVLELINKPSQIFFMP